MADAAKLNHYLTELAKDVDGYLQSGSASIIWSLFEVQEELGITGNIAEIGVYHGRLFVFLCHAAQDCETAFAIDVFDQAPHIQGIETEEDRARFSDTNLKRNLAAAGIADDKTRIVTANSQDITPPEMRALTGGATVRLFSVDGDHSRAGVRHDLGLRPGAARIDSHHLYDIGGGEVAAVVSDHQRDHVVARQIGHDGRRGSPVVHEAPEAARGQGDHRPLIGVNAAAGVDGA